MIRINFIFNVGICRGLMFDVKNEYFNFSHTMYCVKFDIFKFNDNSCINTALKINFVLYVNIRHISKNLFVCELLSNISEFDGISRLSFSTFLR